MANGRRKSLPPVILKPQGDPPVIVHCIAIFKLKTEQIENNYFKGM